MTEPTESKPQDNFVRDIVEEDRAAGRTTAGFTPASRPSRTATFTSAMPSPSA